MVRKSDCCNAEILQWFGNVTHVLLGGKLEKPELICTKCMKPCKLKLKRASKEVEGK